MKSLFQKQIIFREDITYLITLSEKHFIPAVYLILSFIKLGKKDNILVIGNLRNTKMIDTIKNIGGGGIIYLDEDAIDYGIRMPKFNWKEGEKLREPGWFKQQFIRLSADLFVKTPYALILDSEVFPFKNWDEKKLFEDSAPRYLYWIPEKRKPEWDYKMYIASAMFLKDLPEFGDKVVEYANSDLYLRHISGFQLFSMKNLTYLWKRLEQETDLKQNTDNLINKQPELLFSEYEVYGLAVKYGFFDKQDKTIHYNNLLGWYDNHTEKAFQCFRKDAMWSMCQRYMQFDNDSESYFKYMKSIAGDLNQKLVLKKEVKIHRGGGVIPIVFITDNNYALPTSVAITSLILNKKPETLYKIHIIITGDITAENKKKLVDYGNIKKATIECINVDASLLEKFNVPAYYVTQSALLKFNIAGLLPQYDKILYLDGDILVKSDLSELYATDISNTYLAAVSDLGAIVHFELNKKLNLTKYFNSGVLLLNSLKMRKENFEELLYAIKEANPNYLCMDQDVFNAAVKEKVIFVPLKYNVMFHNLYHLNCGSIPGINNHYGTSYKSYDELLNDAIILHLSSRVKPWKYYDAVLHKEWIRYFRKSPFHSQKLTLTYFYKKEKDKLQKFNIKLTLKKALKNLPVIKQLNGRYWELKNVLDENNNILKDIQKKIEEKK